MDPNDPTAKRFPLIARFRPACHPLPNRVQRLVDLAVEADRHTDPGMASTVYNQSALTASDVGLHELAREMCRQHITAYLHSSPLSAVNAIRALEPVVNLVRLRIRDGRTDEARQRLLELYEAVGAGAPAVLDEVAVPAGLTATYEDRQQVRAWLWRVLLAEGTRTFTATGRWHDALAHLEAHRGVGKRMLDGRQVAVLAALTTEDTRGAAQLLEDTAAGDSWEQAVTACLTVLCRREAGQPFGNELADLVNGYLKREAEPGLTVFDIRLGLTVLEAVGTAEHSAAPRLADRLLHRVAESQDGYAARELLNHSLTITLATEQQLRNCKKLVRACALGTGSLPNELHSGLWAALRTSEAVIRRSLTNSARSRVAPGD